MKKWGIKASAEKTKANILQKSNRQKVETVPVLELNGSKVDFPSTIKMLGILIDRHLGFKEQFENSINKADGDEDEKRKIDTRKTKSPPWNSAQIVISVIPI